MKKYLDVHICMKLFEEAFYHLHLRLNHYVTASWSNNDSSIKAVKIKAIKHCCPNYGFKMGASVLRFVLVLEEK